MTPYKKYDFEELPKYNYLDKKLKRCYIDQDGNQYICENSKEHEILSKTIVHNKYFNEYLNLNGGDFNNKPYGMLQEEYFLMKYKRFIKISHFSEIEDNNTVLFFYNQLSPKQISIVYPT